MLAEALQDLPQRPEVYRFLVRYMVDPAVSGEFRRRLEEASERGKALLFQDVDTSRMRPGVTLEQALELVVILGDGLLPRAVRRSRDLGYLDLDQGDASASGNSPATPSSRGRT